MDPLALNVPPEKTAFPPKVIGVPERVTVAAVLLTVKVPVGRFPEVRVAAEDPTMEIFAVPRAPSLVGVTFPETVRVPELIKQLAAHPE